MKNEKKEYDTLVIELQKSNKSVGSVSIKKSDLDLIINVHGHPRAKVLEDLVSSIEDRK